MNKNLLKRREQKKECRRLVGEEIGARVERAEMFVAAVKHRLDVRC